MSSMFCTQTRQRMLMSAVTVGFALISGAQTLRAQPLETNPTIVRASNGTMVSKRIELGIGKSFIIELPRDAREVFVANPKVANAVVRTARKIFVIGLADGNTSLFALDAEGRQIAELDIVIGRDMNVLRKLLKTAMPASSITVSPVGDSIVLTGLVDSAAEAAQAMDIAKGFIGISALGGAPAASGGAPIGGTVVEGKVINSLTIRGRDQVMLRVTVAEVKREVVKQLGINSALTGSIGGVPVTGVIDNPLKIGLQDQSNSVMRLGTNRNFFNIKAYERAGVMRTLAEPTLTAISGESAKFTAGGEIPIPKTETCSQVGIGLVPVCQVTVEYKPFGVSLVFQPVVLSAGRISLRVATEVTEIEATNQVKFQSITVPAFRVRKADTTIELPSGGTMAIAGLIHQSQRQLINGIPALMNLPVLGALFRSRDYVRDETELMILVTPILAKSTDPGTLVRPDEGYTDSKDPQAAMMGRINKMYGVAGAPNDGRRYRGHVGFIAD